MTLKKAHCRSCGAGNLESILSLGSTPLANALLSKEELKQSEPSYPLDLVFCPRCSLVQITETVSPETLFRQYFYFSSVSDTVLSNARDISQRLISELKLGEENLVIEIASNDGYLLANYLQEGIPVLGIEPATNIARVALDRGIPTISEFFNRELAEQLLLDGKKADVVHANNVVAHVADLHGVVAGIQHILKPDGVAVVENHYVLDLMDKVEFDSIYHEHLCYYSVTSFKNLFSQHGLTLVDVERTPIHGGSLRAFFQCSDGPRLMERTGAERVRGFLREERAWGIGEIDSYRSFQNRVDDLCRELVDRLKGIKAEGKRIAAYGASAKSTTLLNYLGIGRETLEYIVDRSTAKQGFYTPGTHLAIVSPETLLEDMPDYALLLAWNFADEILAQQEEYLRRGGHFIIPIPELRVV